MSFNFKRKEASLVHAGQLIYFAVSLYTNDKLGYSRWIRVGEVKMLPFEAGLTIAAFYRFEIT